MQLGFSRRNVVHPAQQASRRRALKRRRLWFDCLEQREMLSVTTPGTEFQVPTPPTGFQATNNKSVAMASNGDAVVVWADTQTIGSYGIPAPPWTLHFQLYTNNGATLTAGTSGQIPAASDFSLSSAKLQPIVMVARAPDGGKPGTDGNFAVVWNDSTSTYAELFSATGSQLTNPILVGGSGDNRAEGIAMSDSGFDVLYEKGLTQYVQRYSSAGAAEGKAINVGTAYVTPGNSIAMNPSGNFVVTWAAGNSPATWSVLAQRYTSAGKVSGPQITVSTSGGSYPNVAMDSADDFVVTWWGSNLMAETVYANNTLGTAKVVDPAANRETGNNGFTAGIGDTIAMQPNGNYALSWVDLASNTFTIYADTYQLSGAQQQSPFAVYSDASLPYPASTDQLTAAAIDANGDLLVIYSGYGANTNETQLTTDGGVFGDFFLDPPPPAPAVSSAGAASPSGASSASGSTAATDAVFGSLSGDDETLA